MFNAKFDLFFNFYLFGVFFIFLDFYVFVLCFCAFFEELRISNKLIPRVAQTSALEFVSGFKYRIQD